MSSKNLMIEKVSKRFGNVQALDNFSLTVGVGELVALLGPSGCGKTTALRIVAGLEQEDSGHVFVGDKNISAIPAHKRNMGMVFQAYSLFPNLSVEENVAFGLHMRKVDKSKRLKKAAELLELVGLSTQGKRFTYQLSGGQQQRVALARALAFEPEILLLDEPLSALDAQVRVNLREEIRRLQLSLGTTTLFVTHDQEEALAISDRIGVMSHGKLEQIDTPDSLYNEPASPFVAAFIGTMNRIPARVDNGLVEIFGRQLRASTNQTRTGEVLALLRPESITVTAQHGNEATNNAVVINRSFMGPSSRIACRTNSGLLVEALVSSSTTGDIHPGQTVRLDVTATEVMVTHE
ncbi:MAG: ABC transporter ATP-binding protein [Actinobacteria bacterium]|uniref:ABC transporter ATP-binding protein n=1 Tax=Candidatus Fonsibacter lacus TaxID=2576439 RepID=A0A965GDH1_9PROT|nr:ABC transporter ATP-binding protein [Candidatus Fonsibacter lacus]